MARRIIISDMHGCARSFIELVQHKVQLQKDDVLYLLGDYINKGPDSKGVLDFIFFLKRKATKCIASVATTSNISSMASRPPWTKRHLTPAVARKRWRALG
ncbi:MAG: hypothetical protein HC819_19175 [Cyclobacteriaceae bacterium]|nr:hypothetical protein [Cyclobacteriaceae bacterium]